MAATNAYATTDEVAGWLRIDADDTIDDTELEFAMDAAARQIDSWCGWQFYKDGSATARTYSETDPGVYITDHGRVLWLPDPISTTTGFVLKTDAGADGTYETTWTASEYRLEPANGVASGVSGWPYYRIRSIKGRSFHPNREPSVEITADWGWPAVPTAVKQAFLIQTTKIHERRTARGGLVAFGETGGAMSMMMLDADARALLAPYRRVGPHGL